MFHDNHLNRSDSQQTKVASIKTKLKTMPYILSSPPPQPDIFSPRPETPAPPPEFPFLASSSPTPRRHKAIVLPPTPPRPGRRQTRKALSANHYEKVEAIKHRLSFERALAAFPAPPIRSLPASPTSRRSELDLPSRAGRDDWALSSSPMSRSRSRSKSDRRMRDYKKSSITLNTGSGSDENDSDCRTITGIPATPSTASSGWDNFWSEVSYSLYPDMRGTLM